MEYMHAYASPLGGITLASDGEALTGLWFDGQKYFGRGLSAAREERYFSGREPDFLPPLRARGTPFQEMVWEILRAIPYGRTRTYGEIAAQTAQQTGRPRMSAQAVGSAVGRNPISLLIPCHRVVGANGSLTGYAGGVEKKRRLLLLEGVAPGTFFVPQRGTAL